MGKGFCSKCGKDQDKYYPVEDICDECDPKIGVQSKCTICGKVIPDDSDGPSLRLLEKFEDPGFLCSIKCLKKFVNSI